ncbi:MAG TPA: DUF669 domain-containing protein [Accumulibacter sp.]|uniref:DUF669 domain-containing protein n=1 Tax=Accumulibacter sp. TaxID=2053492 RepID=UPI002C8130EC|nr:DUF669 domain-containing protein [Accumulibacter sp.]HMW57733.1 DUF669 domain-containing protein [Accumulibacter sp.]HNN46437.1 DUF669 domain-containing protein [Azospira sp.]
MASLAGFDASVVEPQSAFEPIPAGKYLALISESEMKPTKNGSGQYLQFTFVILDNGPYSGRHLWTRLNLQNRNRTAEEIAQRELSAICRAVGVLCPNDSADLHNLPLAIIVGMERNKETGELTNRIKGYEAAAGNNVPPKPQQTNLPAPPPPPAAQAPAQQQPSTPAVAPWMRSRKVA